MAEFFLLLASLGPISDQLEFIDAGVASVVKEGTHPTLRVSRQRTEFILKDVKLIWNVGFFCFLFFPESW